MFIIIDDKSMSLAFSMYSNRGVYAVLLGSGISRPANILTGWEIALDLCNKVVAIQEEDPVEDPAEWYRIKYRKEPRYDDLFDLLTDSSSARQAVLEPYFVPSFEENEQQLKKPTLAHKSIASLVKKGYIKIILTTNFDRLMESALEDEGIQFNVIANVDALKGSKPYVHSACTLIKLHGDYKDTRIKNIAIELAEYHSEINLLLDRIFDEFGLILVGWSGEWDQALRDAMFRSVNRRYGWYWLVKGILSERAEEIVRQREANVISIDDADHFFNQLSNQIASLEKLKSIHPLTPQVVSNITKKAISNGKNIELNDLLTEETIKIRREFAEYNLNPQEFYQNVEDEQLLSYLNKCKVLLSILSPIAYYGSKTEFSLVKKTIERLYPIRIGVSKGLTNLSYLPTLLCIYVTGILSIASGNNANLCEILINPRCYDVGGKSVHVTYLFNSVYVFDATSAHNRYLLQLNFTNHPEIFSGSVFLFHALKPILSEYLPTDLEYQEAFDIFDYLLGLACYDSHDYGPIGRFGFKYESRKAIYEYFNKGLKEKDNWSIVQYLFEGDWTRMLQKVKGFDQLINSTNRQLGSNNIGNFELGNLYKPS